LTFAHKGVPLRAPLGTWGPYGHTEVDGP
jgi:hypothetical protein